MIEVLMDKIDEATAPSVMSKEEALDFLGDLCGQIEGRIEALREEIEAEHND